MIKIVDYGHMKVSDLIEGFMEDTNKENKEVINEADASFFYAVKEI